MKRTISLIFGAFSVLALTMILTTGTAYSQEGCKPFRALGQGLLRPAQKMAPSDVWGGTLYASLDGEALTGYFGGNDGLVTRQGVNGQGEGGVYRAGFGCTLDPVTNLYTCAHTIVFEAQHSVFPVMPGWIGFGVDHANTATITSGTGRFANAWGNLNFGGPYYVWANPNAPPAKLGRFNADLYGMICGAE